MVKKTSENYLYFVLSFVFQTENEPITKPWYIMFFTVFSYRTSKWIDWSFWYVNITWISQCQFCQFHTLFTVIREVGEYFSFLKKKFSFKKNQSTKCTAIYLSTFCSSIYMYIIWTYMQSIVVKSFESCQYLLLHVKDVTQRMIQF